MAIIDNCHNGLGVRVFLKPNFLGPTPYITLDLEVQPHDRFHTVRARSHPGKLARQTADQTVGSTWRVIQGLGIRDMVSGKSNGKEEG